MNVLYHPINVHSMQIAPTWLEVIAARVTHSTEGAEQLVQVRLTKH